MMTGIQQVRTPAKYGGLYLGIRRRVTVPAPAAGAEWSLTVPAGGWLRLLLGRYKFTASAAVANRTMNLDIGDGSVVIGGAFAGASVTAGQAIVVNIVGVEGNNQATAAVGTLKVTFPEVWLPPGYTITSRTVAIDGADQYSAVELLFDELDDGLYGNDIGRYPMEPSYLLEGS